MTSVWLASKVNVQASDPIWIGIGGTILAIAVFLNGYRLSQDGGQRRRLGQFHMLLAPAFVVLLLIILYLDEGV